MVAIILLQRRYNGTPNLQHYRKVLPCMFINSTHLHLALFDQAPQLSFRLCLHGKNRIWLLWHDQEQNLHCLQDILSCMQLQPDEYPIITEPNTVVDVYGIVFRASIHTISLWTFQERNIERNWDILSCIQVSPTSAHSRPASQWPKESWSFRRNESHPEEYSKWKHAATETIDAAYPYVRSSTRYQTHL